MKLENIGFYSLSDERAANTSETSQMKRCEMIINEQCNFKCPYCRGLDGSVFGDRKRRELTIDEIKRNIDLWCDNDPLENIRFSGGEPTLHKNIVEAISYAKEKGIKRIAISTNGSSRIKLYQSLLDAGCNDFSISLDADNGLTGDMMAGNIIGSWGKVIESIKYISERTYVTVGVVLEPENVTRFIDIVKFASDLGVSDIRVIPSAQWNEPLTQLSDIPLSILDKHPILKYRVNNFITGKRIRGLKNGDAKSCPIVLDDSVIAGQDHYPCVIYMREQGKPIGKVGKSMRSDRVNWFRTSNPHNDSICNKNCLDVCVDYNKKAEASLIQRFKL
jgi:molybdenum cofactor biosynthesis enzyme MoaA